MERSVLRFEAAHRTCSLVFVLPSTCIVKSVAPDAVAFPFAALPMVAEGRVLGDAVEGTDRVDLVRAASVKSVTEPRLGRGGGGELRTQLRSPTSFRFASSHSTQHTHPSNIKREYHTRWASSVDGLGNIPVRKNRFELPLS